MANPGTATIDFGSTPVANAQFTVTDAAITSAMNVEPFIMAVDSTGDNNQESHRHAGASWKLSALPATGSFTLYVDCLIDMCHGTFKVRYAYV